MAVFMYRWLDLRGEASHLDRDEERGPGFPGPLSFAWIRSPGALRPDVNAAVDVQGLARDVVAVLDEVADGARDLVGLTEAPQRHGLQELALRLLGNGGDHVRVYEARADGVHGDAVAGELQRGGLGEAEHPALGRRVVGLADVPRLPDEGAHVDDLAAPGLGHVRQHGVNGVERAVEVHLDDLVPVVHGQLPQSLVYVDAGVVDEHVHPTEVAYGLVYELLRLLGVRDVRLNRDRLPAGLFDLVDQLLRGLLAARVVDHYLRPAGGEFLGDRRPKPPASPRDDHHSLFQSAHYPSLFPCFSLGAVY